MNPTLPAIAAILIATTVSAFPQGGPITPPGAPAPSMRSLQEIWDKLDLVENQNTALLEQSLNLGAEIRSLHANSIAGFQAGDMMPWKTDIIDSISDNTSRTFLRPSIAYGPDALPLVAFRINPAPTTGSPLRLARFDGSSWNIEEIGSAATAAGGSPSLALNPDGEPTIAQASSSGVRLWTEESGVWSNVIANANTNQFTQTSLAFDHEGHPMIAHRTSPGVLQLSRFDGTSWSTESLDFMGSDMVNIDLATDPNGHPALAYERIESGFHQIRLARWNGTSWTFGNIYSWMLMSPAIPMSVSLAFDSDGNPGVAIFDPYLEFLPRGLLLRGNPPGSTFHPIPDIEPTGLHQLAITSTDRYLITSRDDNSRRLILSAFDGQSWSQTSIDGIGETGFSHDIAIGPGDIPGIIYTANGGKTLKFATQPSYPRP